MLWGYKETNRWTNTSGKTVSEGIVFLNGKPFKAISGGGGLGCLEAGKYQLMKANYLAKDHANIESYTREGLSFFSALNPLFATIRTFLGLHPDGGARGTLGCLGLIEKIKLAWDILSEIKPEGVEFEVVMIGGKQ